MGTPLHIALRYLFAKKKHNVINIISIISAAGIAIGSMALILILSVYNGFDNSIREIYESYKADFTITPSTGKTLKITPSELTAISGIKGVAHVAPIISDNVFVEYNGKEAIATVIGIDSSYLEFNPIATHLIEGTPTLHKGETKYALIGEDLARGLELRVRFLNSLKLYYPKREGEFSVTNPSAAINAKKVFPSAILHNTAGNQITNAIYVDTSVAGELLGQKENEYSSLEIYIRDKANGEEIGRCLNELLPDKIVKDKLQQNSTLYKMMKAEKFAVYLILFFVIAIISINIFSCLSMLVTDKKDDIETFMSMGATKEMITRIFHLHGFLISATGCCLGTAIGLTVAILQKELGFISIPGNYIVSAYPVEIQLADIAITVAGVCIIGFLISYLPAKKIFKK